MIRYINTIAVSLALVLTAFSSDAHSADFTPSRIVLERDKTGTIHTVRGSAGPESLFEEIELGSPRRILIGLRTPFNASEVNLHGPEGPELYRHYAGEARQSFLNEFKRSHPEYPASSIVELEETPFLILFPTKETLRFILDHPEVISINTESGGPPLLDESTPFIGADIAHSQGHTGKWRAVAVIDTGVDRNHPMFSGKVISEACYSSSDYTSMGSICQAGGYGSVGTDTGGRCIIEKTPCSVDSVACDLEQHCHSGHGSHVAGVASGKLAFPGSGPLSIKGVAHEASIISIMPFSHVENPFICSPASSPCFLFLESSVAAALNHVYSLRHTHTIKSVNLSFILSADSSDYSATNCDNSWPAVRDAVDLLSSADIQVYAASGNFGNFSSYHNKIGPPSCLSKIISVAATSKNSDQFASYSNAAGILDLLAPGGMSNQSSGITCRDHITLPHGIWSAYSHTGCNDDYFQDAGTSMASPHAAGAHAILQSRYPQASIQAIGDWLAASGEPINFSQGFSNYTKPRINLDAAMTPPTSPGSAPATGSVDWLYCYGNNMASWDAVSGMVTEYHLQGTTTGWMYYRGAATSQLISVSQVENLRVRACNMVACGPWNVIGQATYQPHCH